MTCIVSQINFLVNVLQKAFRDSKNVLILLDIAPDSLSNTCFISGLTQLRLPSQRLAHLTDNSFVLYNQQVIADLPWNVGHAILNVA